MLAEHERVRAERDRLAEEMARMAEPIAQIAHIVWDAFIAVAGLPSASVVSAGAGAKDQLYVKRPATSPSLPPADRGSG